MTTGELKRRLLKAFKRMLLTILCLAGLLFAVIFFYMKQTKFGQKPSGERLALIQQSPNYKDGQFQNLHATTELVEGHTAIGSAYEHFFKAAARRRPTDSIPAIKTDLLHLSPNEDILVWFGHSSYFMQIDGKRILVDPVFSNNASPVPGTNKPFKGTNIYSSDDLPDIDYLFISHDHFDHLDYETIIKLQPKIAKVICGLGVGAHFEYWGYDNSKIIERDWYEAIHLDSGFTAVVTPARHFSGRVFSKNNTLWASYVLQTPTMKIFIGGDSGYDTHFATIGEQYGPFDLAIIENGQYNAAWKLIHTFPEEVLQAAKDLKAKRLFPVHSSKFAEANHSWDEPLIKLSTLSKAGNMPLVTPMIGELVNLKDEQHQFKQWWVGIN
jgi:L-ascorbate metabolism protein UlaG (beta-lactamase superfamily)